VVLGRGLGWLGLLCSFVRFYGDAENGYAATTTTTTTTSSNEEDGSSSSNHDQHQSSERKKPPLIFVLNLRENERQILLSTLASWGTPTDQLPRIITNESGQHNERAALYARGGVFVITSRILIVDLLTGVANARDIEGMLVAHAERVCGEKSTEAFILRIFKSQKHFASFGATGGSDGNTNANSRGGFVKAFTDNPSSLVSGFAKVDKILKSLQVQRVYLYPRFHESVAEELEVQPPTVMELHQPLSEKMKEIQNNLAAAIRACLRDLRQKCQVVDFSFLFDVGNGKRGKRKRDDDVHVASSSSSTLDEYPHQHPGLKKNKKKSSKGDIIEDWKFTIQQCISTNFGYILSRQLDGDWHRLSRDVKQSINDLKTLSQLFHYLIGKRRDVNSFLFGISRKQSHLLIIHTTKNTIASNSGESYRMSRQ